MKPSSLSLSAAATALLLVAVFALTATSQAPQAVPSQQPAAGSPAPHRDHPHSPPTNLKVLPRNLTGDQVHEIMEGWEAALGVHCGACHTADPKNMGPNGRPRLNYADDSKPEKATARLMYTMTEDINRNYVSKVPNSEVPVTCGTCHRGHLGPEPFGVPPEDGTRPAKSAPAAGIAPTHTK